MAEKNIEEKKVVGVPVEVKAQGEAQVEALVAAPVGNKDSEQVSPRTRKNQLQRELAQSRRKQSLLVRMRGTMIVLFIVTGLLGLFYAITDNGAAVAAAIVSGIAGAMFAVGVVLLAFTDVPATPREDIQRLEDELAELHPGLENIQRVPIAWQ